jgi:hypothetical protein
MLVETPASQAFEAAFDNEASPVSPTAIDEMFSGGQSPEQTTGAETQSPELTGKPPELTGPAIESGKPEASQPTEEDLAERLWWDKCAVLGKIKDCARLIQETEGEIDGYQDQIKEAKEVLKGQQALLARYSSQLADILDGHPLPKNPNATDGEASQTGSQPGQGVAVADAVAANNWRAGITSEVISGLPKMGPKKLESLCEIAPTMGQLIDLQIQASKACIPFKDNLPKGWGVELVDALENRIVEYMGKFSDEPDGESASDDEPIAASDAGE